MSSNVQTQENPLSAKWSASNRIPCCQMSANQDTGIVNAVQVRIAPNITLGQIIDKYGEPQFVNTARYSNQEVLITLIYPDQGLIVWVTPGDPTSAVEETSLVVIYMYFDKTEWERIQDMGTFQGWMGYKPYTEYESATPVVTPIVTATLE